MEVTLAELLEGKATIIKNRDYLSTSEYVRPFLDKMSKYTEDFRIKVQLPNQMTMGGALQDITYNRVLVEAVLPEKYCIDDHDEVIGFLYGLDVRKPISKVYRGHLNRACTNLCVFDNKWMIVNEVKPGEAIDVSTEKLMELNNPFDQYIKRLKSQVISKEDTYNMLGSWIDMSLRDWYSNGIQNVRISPTTAVEAYKSLFIDMDSPYFTGKEEPSLFTVYNAFTQVITDDKKDIMNSFEKTMLVNKLLRIK